VFLFAGPGQTLDGKLEFKHRLSIALGAAKGDPLQNQSAFWLSWYQFFFPLDIMPSSVQKNRERGEGGEKKRNINIGFTKYCRVW
jgi:hypothetical protein